MAILANLDQHLKDAGWKVIRRRPNHNRRFFTVEEIIATFGDDPRGSLSRGLVCRECHTPIQSDDVLGVCGECLHDEYM